MRGTAVDGESSLSSNISVSHANKPQTPAPAATRHHLAKKDPYLLAVSKQIIISRPFYLYVIISHLYIKCVHNDRQRFTSPTSVAKYSHEVWGWIMRDTTHSGPRECFRQKASATALGSSPRFTPS